MLGPSTTAGFVVLDLPGFLKVELLIGESILCMCTSDVSNSQGIQAVTCQGAHRQPASLSLLDILLCKYMWVD
jgi:hypothetical protein